MIDAGVTFAPGRRIGNYELLVELASGGTATVGIAIYRGAEGFERLVVVKRVHRFLTKDREFMTMLLDEAKLASSVRSPHVVPVIDVVRADDEVVLVMDYVEAAALAQLVKEAARDGKRLPIAVVSRIACDVLLGLHEAHEAVDLRRQPLGIVHRDVSPQNVLVGVDGIARVIDFGIAKATSRAATTRAGVIKGKCAYMAPEQVDGLPVDRRADVFAAGIVIWEALTGQRLFKGEDDFDDMKRVMRAPIPPPSSIAPECGPDVDVVLSHALARPLEERFQTARAFARALEQAIPPAPARVVGEHVAAICGTELGYRHSRLQALLGDELDKISPRAPARPPPVNGTPPERVSHEPTLRIQEEKAPVAPTMASQEAMGPTETPVEADVVTGLPRRSATPVVIAVTIASLLVGAGAGALVLARQGASAGTATAVVPATATVSATATATGAASATATGAATATASATGAATASATGAATAPSSSASHGRLRPGPAPTRELKSNPYEH
jgi:serine/threonine-protein kinase